jgi:hypothetical protein
LWRDHGPTTTSRQTIGRVGKVARHRTWHEFNPDARAYERAAAPRRRASASFSPSKSMGDATSRKMRELGSQLLHNCCTNLTWTRLTTPNGRILEETRSRRADSNCRPAAYEFVLTVCEPVSFARSDTRDTAPCRHLAPTPLHRIRRPSEPRQPSPRQSDLSEL